MSSSNGLPDGWVRSRVSQLADTYSGGTPDRAREHYFGGDIPWVKSGEVNSYLIDQTGETLTQAGLEASSAKWVPKGSILGAMYGATAGRFAWLGIDATINQALLAICPKNGTYARFLFHLLHNSTARYLSQCQGSGQPNLNGELINGLEVLVPPHAEQVAIASILDAVDDAIERTSEVIEQTRKLKGAVLQDLLTNGLPRRHTEFVEVRLGDVFQPRKESGVAALPRVAVTMHNGLVDRDEIERRMETNLRDDQHLLVRCGDIAYNMMRMWQGVFGLAEFDCLVSPAYVVVEPIGGLRSDYASHLFKLPATIRKFHLFSQGLTEDRLRLYFEQFAPIKVRIPRSVDEQARIVELLATLDQRIASQSEELTQLTEAKSALSQALLTGQVRVPTAEVASA